MEGEPTGTILRCFDGTDPTIVQPALDENIVAIHLGGAKRVHRWCGRMHQSWDVPSHAITLVPAFRANRWHTEGVIAFAHLTLSAGLMARLARDEFDRDPGEIALRFPQPVEVGQLIGRTVLQPVESQNVLGHVRSVVRDDKGQVLVVMSFGGFLGFGSRLIAVPIDAMVLLGDVMEVAAYTPPQLSQFATFDPAGTTPVPPDTVVRVGLAKPSH